MSSYISWRCVCRKKISHKLELLKDINKTFLEFYNKIEQIVLIETEHNQDKFGNKIYVKNDGIYFDTQQIIKKQSNIQFAIFAVLIEHYFYEVINGPSFIPPSNICIKLLQAHKIDIDEQQVRIYIYRMRSKFKKYEHNSHPIIVSEKWKGYRISDYIQLCRFSM